MKTSGSNMNYVGCPSLSALRTSFGDNNPAIVFYIGSSTVIELIHSCGVTGNGKDQTLSQ